MLPEYHFCTFVTDGFFFYSGIDKVILRVFLIIYIFSDEGKRLPNLLKMSADESCADPSLPLQDQTLAGGGEPPLSRSVHWAADTCGPAPPGEDNRWQMDGSNQSIGKQNLCTLLFSVLGSPVL